jgi:hypothetical protein
MKIRTPNHRTPAETALLADRNSGRDRSMTRRQLFDGAGRIIAATALTSAAASMLAPIDAALASSTAGAARKKPPMSPEIKLVDDYNTWFQGAFDDPAKMKVGLPKYITNETVLHEAVSLPWGGTMVGYDGWAHLHESGKAVWELLYPNVEVSGPEYYQHRNVVLHEITMTIKPTKAAPTPFVMGILEKYTVENGRIKQIDEFYQDTASFLERLRVLGILLQGKGSST